MSNFLDVDESLIARNLLFGNNLPLNNDAGFPGGVGDGLSVQPSASRSGGINILTPSERQAQSQCKFIIPHPGLCIKTREIITNHKVFINLCKSEDVPEPDAYFTDEQIGNILSTGSDEEVQDIRLPMSIGEKHIEKDKTGAMCPAFDVVINTTFFDSKILVSEMYRTFLIVVTIEGIEEKFKLELDKNNYTILQHKKSMGKLDPQLVKSRPGIKELKPSLSLNKTEALSSTATTKSEGKKALVEELFTKELQLDCNIKQVSRELAKAEIKLPNLKNPKKLQVTLGADRIIVDSPVGSLDIFVPLDIHQEESKAEYNAITSVLTLNLPLVIKP